MITVKVVATAAIVMTLARMGILITTYDNNEKIHSLLLS
jgi:hypothetical protein